MSGKKNSSGISSEALFAILIVLILIVLVSYYIYHEEVLVRKQYPQADQEPKQPRQEPLPDIQKIIADWDKMLPVCKTDSQIIRHLAYTLSYNEQAEQASWVFYELTAEHVNGKGKRSDSFRRDPQVKTESASNDDYFRSGYDKGHLAPAADFRWNEKAIAESFYLSNISPQKAAFNRGIWKQLEEQVRDWAVQDDSVYVVVGGVLKELLPKIGKNKVAVPEYFFKIVLDIAPPEFNGIGFIMKNDASDEPLEKFAVSIDSVEKFTGIDFFPGLPDDMEDSVETGLSHQNWTFTK